MSCNQDRPQRIQRPDVSRFKDQELSSLIRDESIYVNISRDTTLVPAQSGHLCRVRSPKDLLDRRQIPTSLLTVDESGLLNSGWNHVQFAAPEGFSANWSALAHTIPRIADSFSRLTRFHHSLFRVDWTDYAISSLPGQPLIQSRLRIFLAMRRAKKESKIKITESVNAMSRSNSKPI